MLSVFSIGSFAQDNRTLDTKVADVLAQMPTKNLTHRDNAMNELIELGPEGFQKLTAMLTPPAVGDDTAVRFALNSLSRYASQFGKCEARAFTEDNILIAFNEPVKLGWQQKNYPRNFGIFNRRRTLRTSNTNTFVVEHEDCF